ncbi:hypothetical protein JCM24511_00190 [Saitozyma sp. JCM 24511]|nr:hypothetical protein JCM24511_00190 [Saitozyma sp. JCM 24511]
MARSVPSRRARPASPPPSSAPSTSDSDDAAPPPAKRRKSRSRTPSRKPSKEHTSKYPKHKGESKFKGGRKSKVDKGNKFTGRRNQGTSGSSSDEEFSPSSEDPGEVEAVSEESDSDVDESESDQSLSEPSPKHKHPPKTISITTNAKSSKRHRDSVSEKEAPHFIYDGVRVSKADFEAFLRLQNKTGHKDHLIDEDAGGSEGEKEDAEDEDPKWEVEIDLGELEESDDEEDLDELKDRASGDQARYGADQQRRRLTAALEEPFEQIKSQSTAALKAQLNGMTTALETASEPFRGTKILQQLQLWCEAEKPIQLVCSEKWEHAATAVNKNRATIEVVLKKIEAVHKEKANLVAQAKEELHETLKRQDQEFQSFKKEVDKSKGKYRRKLEKATDSQRQAKDIRMAYEEIIKARI